MSHFPCLIFLLLVCLLCGCSTEKKIDTYIQENNSIPLSQVAQELSANLSWDVAEHKAYIQKEDYYAVIQPKNDIILIQGEPYRMDFPAYLKNREVYIPVRTYLQDLKSIFFYQVKNIEEEIPEPFYKIENSSHPEVLFQEFSVMIDPGHGGKDTGAIAKNGTQEKNFNLDIATRLSLLLQEKGAKVFISRNQDYFLSLDQRIAFANQNRPDCLVSIHLNSALTPKASGFEVWISTNSKSRQYSSSLMLAKFIRSAFQKNTPLADRGVRKNAFRIIHETHVPSVLVECCFLSNKQDLEWVSKEEQRQKLAHCIMQGIHAYYIHRKKKK